MSLVVAEESKAIEQQQSEEPVQKEYTITPFQA
jgi:hypothetical protein